MDLEEDARLIELFQKQQQQANDSKGLQDEVDRLQSQVQTLNDKLKAKFLVISEQADIIRRYRSLLRKSIEDLPSGVLDAMPVVPVVPVISAVPVVVPPSPVLSEKDPDSNEPLSTSSSDSPCDAKESKRKKRKRVPVLTKAKSAIKLRRLNQIVDQSKIKRPTQADDYRETHVGQAIWNAIIRCFENSDGGLVTEDMIIQAGGKNLLTNKDKPFLDKKMINRYFSYPFTFTEEDETMVVRPLTTADNKSWVVFLPDWLQKKLSEEALQDFQL